MRKIIAFAAEIGVLLIAVLTSACSLPGNNSSNDSINGGVVAMKLSSEFGQGDQLPIEFTCDGEGVSPPLLINGVPSDAKSLVVILEDPDAPAGTFTHWIVWNISTDTAQIPKGRALGEEGMNDFGKKGYGGPCPPSGIHHYNFRLFALDAKLDLPSTTNRKAIDRAMKSHVIAETRLSTVYSR